MSLYKILIKTKLDTLIYIKNNFFITGFGKEN